MGRTVAIVTVKMIFISLVVMTSGIGTSPIPYQTQMHSGISMTIDYGNGSISTFADLQGTDVLNVTQSVAYVDIEWYGEFAFVAGIDGVYNDNTADIWWQYWVNGVYGPRAVNQYILTDGAHILWNRTGPLMNPDQTQQSDYSTILATLSLGIVSVILVGMYYQVKVRNT